MFLFNEIDEWFLVGRFNLHSDPFWEIAQFFQESGLQNELTSSTYTQGKYVMQRQGDVMSGWIDDGNGLILLGSVSDPTFTGPVTMQLRAAQGVRPTGFRSFSDLDVRYDNVVITADQIIPEPATLSLLILGALLTGRRQRS